MNQDIIFVEHLRIDTIIGVHAKERQQTQTLIIDLELMCNFQNASASDSIKDTVDYEDLVHKLTEYIQQQNFQLLETLANHIAEFLLSNFNIEKIKLKITKPNALAQTKWVGVLVTREKKDIKTKESF